MSNFQNFHIALKCDTGLDQRVYNVPTTTEIAAIWVDENDGSAIHTPHLQIYTHSDKTQRVNYYFGCYDPLQYPLLFPHGQSGWHCGIKKLPKPENIPRSRTLEFEQLPNIKKFTSVDGYLDMEAQNLQKRKRKRDVVSVREYYCYKLQMRNNDEDEILHTGRLFQQYSVDEYIKLETQRLDFVSFNQDLFRMGGPRDMRQRYMDAIALVQRFRKPDLFITMTCNLSWTEIKEQLWSTDEAQNRPDLITRVFRAKIEELKTDILKRNIFGKVVAFMYTVEFQKRGLSHAHILIILGNKHKLLTAEAYDDIIRAELPDGKAEPDLRKIVIKHMMHGPCVYRRRNTGEVVKVREQYLDNSWVVPYNPYLLGKFNCHINVEVCSDIKVVKYLYKYICKGHDKIAFCVQNNDTDIEIDEVKEYRSARWVSPPKAVWRLFGFPISEMTPSVYRLQLHLEGQQFVSFKSNADIHTIVNNPMIQKTMLTEFFYMNNTDEDAKELNLLYKEFPEYFV
ncbi:PREDICTED: uncharacterized protein LOC109212634 [Nicotiana attenuata]|uniref:uncharacterized protein LOC109212634 n=1 Tax=Nicotiana attenuata TaxID=49451 RepID=UPI000904632F|nr:PREDICTED: uncharacterized protein LOC109212634 [Nicotiana attenuata]